MKVWMKILAVVATGVLCCGAQTSAPSSPASPAPSAAPAASPSATTASQAPEPESTSTSTPAGSGISQTAPQAETPATSPPAPPPAAESILTSPPAKKPGATGAGDSAPPAAKGPANLYVIGPLDVLYVKVWNHPNLTGMVDVQDDGMISMALIGQLKAEGLTIDQLTKLISTKLDDYFQSTEGEVTVQLTKNNSKKYYIMGQGAGHQGAFP